MSKLILTTEGDTSIVVKRRFAAAPELVYRAHTEAEMIRQWSFCPEGWIMHVRINEARPGGRIRHEWSNGKGGEFHLTGEYLELVPYSRIVRVERMHLPDPRPDMHVETTFAADGSGTFMTTRITLPRAEVRAAMLATGMEFGMEAGYFKLESIIAKSSPRISTPQIVETSTQEAAVIHLAIPSGAMMRRFKLAVRELLAELEAQGIESIGEVFAHYLKTAPDSFEFELGIKVAAPVKESGSVKPGALPASRVARAIYSGPYDGLLQARQDLNDWVKANGLIPAQDLWESYSVGPLASPDPSDWRTELNQPLVG